MRKTFITHKIEIPDIREHSVTNDKRLKVYRSISFIRSIFLKDEVDFDLKSIEEPQKLIDALNQVGEYHKLKTVEA